MRRSDTSAWGVLATLLALAACSPPQGGRDGRIGAAEPDSASGQAAAAQAAGSEAVASRVLESPFVERDAERATFHSANPAAATSPQSVPGQVLVKFRRTTTRARMENALARVPQAKAAQLARSVPQLYRVTLGAGTSIEDALDTYRRQSDVEYAEPNYILSINATPNDPRFGELWGLQNSGQLGGSSDVDIDATDAWDVTQGSAELVVAVIDTGIDYNHVDLAANMHRNTVECTANGVDDDANGYIDDCYGIDTYNGDVNPFDDHGHGTHVAGTIGAVGNNGIGVAGVAWNVKMIGCKFLGGSGFGSTDGAVACLDYIADLKDRGVNIIATNNSWGGGGYSLALRDAIEATRQKGILFIAAAGNYTTNVDLSPNYPCSYDAANIVCVAAINRHGALAWFSNYGRRSVHVGAPGEEILSTFPNNAYSVLNGTSMATPHVTGAAVLLKAHDANRDWRAIKNLLMTGSETPMPTQLIAGSRINAQLSMSCSNRELVRKLAPNTEAQPVYGGIGTQVELVAASIRCAGTNGPVSVAVSNGGGTVMLVDDGTGNDDVAGDGVATGLWTATQGGQFTLTFPGGDTATATIDAHLRAGFPVKVPYTSGSGVSGNNIHAVVGDIDADVGLEILLSALGQGPVHAWNPDGSSVAGWPTSQQWGFGLPVIGNFENIVSGAKIGVSYLYGNHALFAQDGAVRAGWPQSSGSYYALRPPIAADLDDDGADELIDATIRRADGTSLGLNVPQTDAVADLDGDGDVELISLSQNFYPYALRVHHHDGTEAVEFSQALGAGSIHASSTAVGDVDGDGTPEIIVAVNEGATLQLRLYNAWKHRTLDVSTQGEPIGGLALADLTNDGIPEILVQTPSRVYAVRGDGTAVAGWPVATGSPYLGNSAPIVGDIDGDGTPDVVVTVPSTTGNGSTIVAWSADGSQLADFPKPIPLLGQGGVPAIADLEGDDDNELIVVGDHWSGFNGEFDRLWVFDFQTSGAAGPIEWGQYKGGPDHKAFYELGKNLADDAYLTVQLRGAGSVASSTAGIACGADCIERYARNTSVTLTAMPNGGTFVGWLGACVGQSNPCTVSVQERTSVVARFSRQPLAVSIVNPTLGSVSSNPSGISCPSDCAEDFTAGASVTLTAAPSATATFAGWGGACSGEAPTCSIAMNSAKTVTALFIPKPQLSVTVAGIAGGRVTSTPAGIDCGPTCTALFERDSGVTLTATETDDYIVNWSGACYGSASSCFVYMSGDTQVTATFVPKHTLTLTRSGETAPVIYSSPSGLNCGAVCSYRFGQGEHVTLFVDSSEYDATWSGACTGMQSSCSVQMSSARSVSVNLARKVRLTLTKTGPTDVLVDSTPYGIFCPSYCATTEALFSRNATVTLRAASSAFLVTWSGACTGNGATCTVTMDEAKSVVANFQSPVLLSVLKTGNGVVNSDPAGINCGAVCTTGYPSGTIVSLIATPAPGAEFSSWSGACTGSATTCTVTMDAARFVAANFIARPTLQVLTNAFAGTVTSSPTGINCVNGIGAGCSTTFLLNETVTLTATPTNLTVFSHWSGACTGTTPSCTVTMTTGRLAIANFIMKNALLIVVQGGGTVTSSPSGIDCGTQCQSYFAPNSVVTLTAQPLAGQEFIGWTGACSGLSTTCSVTMTLGQSATATFRGITAQANTGGGGGGGGGGAIDWRWVSLLLLLGLARIASARARCWAYPPRN